MSTSLENLNVSVRGILSACAIFFLLVGEYIVLHKEIEEAKRLPASEISKEEYTYDKKTILQEIEFLKEDLEKLKTKGKK